MGRRRESYLGKKESEFTVESAPDVVLGMVQGFFESDEWP